MSTPAIYTELLRDPILAIHVAALEETIADVRWFAAHPYTSIFKHTRQYTAWHNHVLHTSKKFIRWVLPVWHSSAARTTSTEVYGKRPSSLTAIGDHTVSKFIRFLLFELKQEPNAVWNFLSTRNDCPASTVQSLVRRMLRRKEHYTHLWERERLEDPSTLELFQSVWRGEVAR